MAQTTLAKLLQLILVEDYIGAMAFIESDRFDPNEADPLYKTSLLQGLVPQVSGMKNIVGGRGLKEVLMKLISHKDFNPNAKDVDNETILMTLSKYPAFNWLSKALLTRKDLVYNMRDSYARTAYDIASTQRNTKFMELYMERLSSGKGLTAHLGNFKKIAAKRIFKADVTSAKTTKAKDDTTPQDNLIPEQVMQHLKFSFTESQRSNPASMYWLIRAVLLRDYDEALKLSSSAFLNPSEEDIWDEPAFMDMIEYIEMASDDIKYDTTMLQKIFDNVMSNRYFNPNMKNGDGDTPIMLAVRYKKFNWLTKKLYGMAGTELHYVNSSGKNILKIANEAGNDAFILSLASPTTT